MVSQRFDSGSPPTQLVSMSGSYFAAYSVSKDGRFLSFSVTDPKTNGDIWWLDLRVRAEKPAARPFANSSANEASAAFSPDGRWVAYTSDESGAYEVYLGRFPGGELKRRVSTSGGFAPQWSFDGRELYFQADYGEKMMLASVRTEPELIVSEPRLLFAGHYLHDSGGAGHTYAVARDGRFLMIKSELPGLASELVIVQNWFEQLKRLPVK